ncbi:hypothetical protein AAG895_01015 [Thauera sp. JM12B12]|uniref:hypothetical protein n=1 Tax=Thauera sp. JM12B12 TaxID=3142262 RepID=UPI0031F431F5
MSPQHARTAITERGLRLEPFGGTAHRVHGRGVDVLVSDLRWLKESDLRPIPAQGPGAASFLEIKLSYQR